ncbi:MAG: ABC transporter ATP-binding protein [Anaerolineae bacterium]
MSSTSPPALIITGLYYAYPPLLPDRPAVEVLRGVTGQVQRGELVALIGRVGSGKTTLCLAVNGLVPQATGGRFRGQVLVGGRDTRHYPVPALARWAGLVFQDAEAQFTQMRVEDEIAFGPENLGLPPAEIEQRVTWALAAVGLSSYRDRSPRLLSGGEKQRVAIAAMLAMQPELLALDDPTANLDPAGKANVFRLLSRLTHRQGLAVLIATQELELVARYADRVWVLHEGRIGLEGPPQQVFRQTAQLQEWGIGLPQLVELGALMTRRWQRPFYFLGVGQAYAQLRPLLLSNVAQGDRLAGGAAIGRGLGIEAVRKPVFPSADHAAPSPGGMHPVPWRSYPDTGPPRSGPLISLEDVTYAYPDGTSALRGITWAIQPGEFVALVGPNGSGKTTLAKLLNGLLKPTSGQVKVAGRDTRAARVPELARTVGHVFQNPDHQIFAATVAEEVAFGLRLQGLPPGQVARRVAEALSQFRLEGHAHLPPALLGSSQRRQVALAAVLAARPQILVLDEPSGGLDGQSLQELMAGVVAFHQQGGAVLLITHDMRLVAEYAEHVAVLLAGQLLFEGSPDALFRNREVLRRAHLAVPPVVRLAQRLAVHGFCDRVLTAAEFVAAWQARVAPAAAASARDEGCHGR